MAAVAMGGELAVIGEGDEVFHKSRHGIGRGGHVGGADRVDAIAADPVLFGADDPSPLCETRAGQKHTIELAHLLDRERRARHRPRQTIDERMKIAENLGLRTIKAMIDAEAVELLVFQKFTRRHLKTLDARGRDGLGPQHHARQRLGIDARARKLKPRQSLLGIRHRACAGGAEKKLVVGKCVGKVRMVRASHALGLVHASTVGLPKAVEINPHARNLSFSLQKRKVTALTFLFQEV